MMVPPNVNAEQLNSDPGALPAQVDQSMQQVQARMEAGDIPGQVIAGAQDNSRAAESAVNSAQQLANTRLQAFKNEIKQSQGLFDDPNSGSSAMLRAAQAGLNQEDLYNAIFDPAQLS